MSNRAKLWALSLIPLALIAGGVGLAAWQLPRFVPDPYQQSQVLLYLLLGGLAVAVTTAALWAYIDWSCFLPLKALARGARIIARSHPGHKLELPQGHLLDELPAIVQELGAALHKTRREVAAAMATGTREIEEQKSRLEAVLRELSEGVLVCDAEARILLYNPAALKLLPNPEAAGLGRSLYEFLPRAPVEDTLQLLRYRQPQAADASGPASDAEFVCAAGGEQRMLHCRMSLFSTSSDLTSAFVITFRDITGRMEHAVTPRPLLETTVDDLRGPLASLRAAAESVSTFEDMEPAQRRAFHQVIAEESARLSQRLEALAHDFRELFATQWSMNDIYSADLVGGVIRRLESGGGPRVALIGAPLWLHVDGHSIVLLVEHLLRQLQASGCGDRFEIECLLGNRRVYLDILWPGRPLPASRIDGWFNQPLQDGVGAASVAEVLRRHNSELWSQPHRRAGHALLRLPLPASRRQWQAEPEAPAERPELYGFTLGRMRSELGKLADQPLAGLTYVVFDIETTGPEPSKGDEVIQIAGVRVVNGRIRAGETFDRLVNPGRPIPKASMRSHGVSEERVRDKPPIAVALPQFKTFVGGDDTVLVAHNAALAMTFLQLKERTTGTRFDNPVLDTLLLSGYLHDYTGDHSLDAIAHRLGVDVQGRHTALGDALVTAQVFVKLLDLLEAHGITTLGQALEASERMVEVRRQQARF